MIIFTNLFALKNSLNTDKLKQSYMRSLQDEIRIDSRFAWKELKDEQMIAQVRNLALDAKMLNTDLQENCEVRLYGKDYPWNALNKIARNDTKSHTFILLSRGGSRILRRGGGANIPFCKISRKPHEIYETVICLEQDASLFQCCFSVMSFSISSVVSC